MRLPPTLTLALATACLAAAVAPPTNPKPPADPDRTLDGMLAPATQRTTTRPGDRPSDPPSTRRASESLTLLREGSFVVDRVGRMRRSTDGQQLEFVFDADGSTLKDPPVILIPNLKLMQMEAEIASANRPLRFRITGVVTEYKSRNYVLLEKVIVLPESR